MCIRDRCLAVEVGRIENQSKNKSKLQEALEEHDTTLLLLISIGVVIFMILLGPDAEVIEPISNLNPF